MSSITTFIKYTLINKTIKILYSHQTVQAVTLKVPVQHWPHFQNWHVFGGLQTKKWCSLTNKISSNMAEGQVAKYPLIITSHVEFVHLYMYTKE